MNVQGSNYISILVRRDKHFLKIIYICMYVWLVLESTCKFKGCRAVHIVDVLSIICATVLQGTF